MQDQAQQDQATAQAAHAEALLDQFYKKGWTIDQFRKSLDKLAEIGLPKQTENVRPDQEIMLCLCGAVVATFENEPGNANLFLDAFPDALHFLLLTEHSPEAEAPRPELIQTDDFLMA